MDQKNVPSINVVKSASAMGAATFLSRILGLVREQVFAIFFGAGNLTDAFQIAFRIPNLLRDLFAEGALSSAFVPTFTRVRKERGDRAAWRVAGLVFRVLFVLVSFLAVVGMIFAPELVTLYASSFKEIPGKFEVTVLMTRVMFPFFPLVALAAAFMGILNANGRFFMPAFASALFNIFSIIFGLLFAWIMPRYGVEAIVGMAMGVVIGGAVQAFSQLPGLYKVGYQWHARDPNEPSWRDEPALRQMMILMLPSMVGLAATQVNVLINSILATSQGPGAVSWLNYAFRLMQFPIGIFGVSLAAATLSKLSQEAVEGDEKAVNKTLTSSLKLVFAVNLPAAAGLAGIALSIVELLFQYGRFTSEDSRHTAEAIVCYSVGLVAYSAVKVLVPACYALRKTQAAVVSSVLSVGVTIGLGYFLVERIGFMGLALSTSIAAFFNFAYLLIVLRRSVEMGGLVRSFITHLLIAGLMGFSVSWMSDWIAANDILSPVLGFNLVIGRLLNVGVLVAAGGVVVVAMGSLFRVEETQRAIDIFRRKIKKS